MEVAILVLAALAVILMVALLIKAFLTSSKNPTTAGFEKLTTSHKQFETTVRDELSKTRSENSDLQSKHRTELTQSVNQFRDAVLKELASSFTQNKELLDSFNKQLVNLTALNDTRLEGIRKTVEQKLTDLQKSNSDKLDEMRKTVDEKLQSTLEKRLGESFNIVSQRLEQVHKGLGEMQNLAAGVGDLKRVLTNVKSRGNWGEIQLEALLENVLTAEQYQRNVKVNPESGEIVDYAIKLPGHDDDQGFIWLPIDSKFPREDYERLIDAQDKADVVVIAEVTKGLIAAIKSQAREINSKYILPPHTTDFGIMFLPTEGLYAEVMRVPGLLESLQRDFRVAVAGPSTLTAFLNSLQMGFRTLAIEKRSSEVWQLLGAVKTEFGKFAGLLESTKKKLQAASNSIDTASRKTRTIERRLRSVEELPGDAAARIIPDELANGEVEEESAGDDDESET